MYRSDIMYSRGEEVRERVKREQDTREDLMRSSMEVLVSVLISVGDEGLL